MEVLADLVGFDPVVVFCGQAGAESSRHREHYYETPGNSFWESLHQAGLTPSRWGPADDHRLPDLGLGLTDLVGHDRRTRIEFAALETRLEAWAPAWLALTSKSVAAEVARACGHRPPGLGIARFDVAGAGVFVLPGTSGANRRRDYDGRPTRIAWWRDLAALVGPELTDRRTDS